MGKNEFLQRRKNLKDKIKQGEKDKKNAWLRGNYMGIEKADREIYNAGLELRKLEDKNPQFT